MRTVQAPRASAILYSLLKSQGSGRPWLLPANICPIVPITFFKAAIPFELVDISAETLHMDLEQAEGRLMQGGIGGILYAHTYGEPSTPRDFFQRVKSYDPAILIIDDRCLCHPDTVPDPYMTADVALYSTGYAKQVDLGIGGYAFLNDTVAYHHFSLDFDENHHARIEASYKQAVRNHKIYVYQESNWLQTDGNLLGWQDYRHRIETGLKHSKVQRTRINRIYRECLPLEIQLPEAYQSWRFNIRLENKTRTLEAICSAGLSASSHYASLAGVMAPGVCPQAEFLAGEVINLFNDHHFDPHRAEQVCAIIMENLP